MLVTEGTDVVLLLPVEVPVRVPGRSLAGRNRPRSEVEAVRPRALQRADVLDGVVRRREVLERFVDHLGVDLEVVLVGPAGDEAGLLVQRRVDDLRDPGQVPERLRTRRRVTQIDLEMLVVLSSTR